jgi:hypothetical protein
MKQISLNALEKRINRNLAQNGEALRQCRETSRWYLDLGDHYIVDIFRNAISDKHVDIEALGRELGVLSASEQLAS